MMTSCQVWGGKLVLEQRQGQGQGGRSRRQGSLAPGPAFAQQFDGPPAGLRDWLGDADRVPKTAR